MVSILGLDTETFEGSVKVLCFSDGSSFETSDTEALLEQIYERGSKHDYNVLWNLGFDVAAILKPYVIEHAEELRQAHYRKIRAQKRLRELQAKRTMEPLNQSDTIEAKALIVELDGMETIERMDTKRFHIQLIGAKGFGIKKHKKRKTVWVFDAAVFYATGFGGMKLETAASRYLGLHKSDKELGIDRARIGSEAGYYERHRSDIIRYCIRDAELTAKLMERTIEAYANIGVNFPKRPFSKGSVSKQVLKDTGCLDTTQAQYAKLSSDGARGLWVKSFQGGVFLQLKAGRVNHPYALDINSAYPDAQRNFPSLEGAEAVDYSDARFPQCYFRFYRIRAKATPRLPLKEKANLRKLYGWTEEEHSFIVTGPDLEALQAWGDTYTIEDAVGIWCPSNDRPLAWLGELFDRKAAVKKQFGGDSVEYSNLKIVMNGVYGVTAQRKPRESRFTNLIYASYTTALCRKKLWLAALEVERSGDYIVQYATDGLLIEDRSHGEGRAAWRSRSSPDLGDWDYSEHKWVVCFESGVYAMADPCRGHKNEEAPEDLHSFGPNLDVRLKRRGFPDLNAKLLQQCNSHYWTSHRAAPVKLKTAIIQRKTANLGVFIPVERELCPSQSYIDAGYSFSPELRSAALALYFEQAWTLFMRNDPRSFYPPSNRSQSIKCGASPQREKK